MKSVCDERECIPDFLPEKLTTTVMSAFAAKVRGVAPNMYPDTEAEA
jgi:hypothetical protein